MQIRLNKTNAKGLRELAKRTHRTPTAEGNIAVEFHVGENSDYTPPARRKARAKKQRT